MPILTFVILAIVAVTIPCVIIFAIAAKAVMQSKIKRQLVAEGFNIDKLIEYNMIFAAFDNVNGKLYVKQPNDKSVMLNMRDIASHELTEEVIDSTTEGGVYQMPYCKSMQLELYMNDAKNPVVKINLITNKVDKPSKMYKVAVDFANEITSMLDAQK